MLRVDQAQAIVLQHARPLGTAEMLLEESLNRRLAMDVAADVDSPPFDKSLVDGYALRSEDVQQGRCDFRLVDELTAGQVSRHEIRPGETVRIMTGAPLPAGADAVVMLEETEILDSQQVRVDREACAPWHNVMRQGASIQRGETVLNRGTRIRAIEVGLCGEVGQARVRVHCRPQVAVLSTGDELVPIERSPGPAQIRNSNGPMLATAIEQADAEPVPLGIARDAMDELKKKITLGLAADVLLISGGVSAGVLDLVPDALRELGVVEAFHKVSLKPGKPLWFGSFDRQEHRCLVFGLPGNPLGGFVCFELFVSLALNVLTGGAARAPQPRPAVLAIDYSHRGNRPTYHPALAEPSPESVRITPVRWQGSADIRGFAAGNALAVFAPGDRDYRAGETIEFLPLPPVDPFAR